jgi:hypothetical protein
MRNLILSQLPATEQCIVGQVNGMPAEPGVALKAKDKTNRLQEDTFRARIKVNSHIKKHCSGFTCLRVDLKNRFPAVLN